jgi:hypothetical protein
VAAVELPSERFSVLDPDNANAVAMLARIRAE